MKARQPQCVTITTVLSLLSVALQSAYVCASAGDHGGVPMGKQNFCDDAKAHEIDWDPQSSEEYTCDGETITQTVQTSFISCEEKPKTGLHVCFPHRIFYTDSPPRSGPHRPNWPDYGEYTYVPPQRWLHNMEHGAIVMLYHPCANPTEVDILRTILTRCLRKHIITPSKLLPLDTPFALLSWGCMLTMGQVDPVEALDFIKKHAKRDGPEGQLPNPGHYVQSLIVPAQNVSDFADSVICPLPPQNEQKTQPDTALNAGGVYTGEPNNLLPGNQPPLSPPSFIFLQSEKRRRLLNRVMGNLQQDVRHLIDSFQAFRQQRPQ